MLNKKKVKLETAGKTKAFLTGAAKETFSASIKHFNQNVQLETESINNVYLANAVLLFFLA